MPDLFRPGAYVSDEKVLGVLIARYLGFDGAAIIEAAVAALVDANFHAEAARVQALLAAAKPLGAAPIPPHTGGPGSRSSALPRPSLGPL